MVDSVCDKRSQVVDDDFMHLNWLKFGSESNANMPLHIQSNENDGKTRHFRLISKFQFRLAIFVFVLLSFLHHSDERLIYNNFQLLPDVNSREYPMENKMNK